MFMLTFLSGVSASIYQPSGQQFTNELSFKYNSCHTSFQIIGLHFEIACAQIKWLITCIYTPAYNGKNALWKSVPTWGRYGTDATEQTVIIYTAEFRNPGAVSVKAITQEQSEEFRNEDWLKYCGWQAPSVLEPTSRDLKGKFVKTGSQCNGLYKRVSFMFNVLVTAQLKESGLRIWTLNLSSESEIMFDYVIPKRIQFP